MERLNLEQLEQDAERYDDLVARTEGVDRFCTASSWVLPAARRLGDGEAPGDPLIVRSEAGYLLFQVRVVPGGVRCLLPLEAVWGLASPLVGEDAEALVDALRDLLEEHRRDFDVVVLAGLLHDSTLLGTVHRQLGNVGALQPRAPTRRWVVDLSDGYDAFVGRRSVRFRRNLRSAQRRAAAAGFVFEEAHGAPRDDAWLRLLDVERRSWKGRAGVGIDEGVAERFYRDITERLDRVGARRLWFLRRDDADVAYVLGGTVGPLYRGLQMSFDAAHADWSPGNLVQAQQVRELCEEGRFTRYDLGTTAADYKRRWADTTVDSATLLVVAR